MVSGSPRRLSPPRRLGKLKLLAKLGEGGMATVYLAAVGEGPLSRLAAVKCLRSGHFDSDYRTRFLDEAKVVVRLHHNNLVDVREAGEIDGQLFISMELIEGRDLADVWDRCAEIGRAFPVPLAVHIIREVLRGLHYAHTFPSLSLVHRDVSPSNVLIDWAGAVRLADFGLATSAIKVANTTPGVVFGKVGYMSPEQAMHRRLDGRSDVYSCGVVLWELLTGRAMRRGMDTSGVAKSEPVPPSEFSRRVDPELDALIVRALAREPERRFPDARAFMEALSRWLITYAPDTRQDSMAAFMTELFGDARNREQATFSELVAEVSGGSRTEMFRRLPTDPLAAKKAKPTVREGTPSAAGLTASPPPSQPVSPVPRDPMQNSAASAAFAGTAAPGTMQAPPGLSQGVHAPRAASSGSAAAAAAAAQVPAVSPPPPVLGAVPNGPVDAALPDPGPGARGLAEHVPAGTVIAERYRILSRLGEGGMGTVYLGEHLTVGRSVAIKILTHGWSRNEGVARRFRAEARAASAAGHPNIVEVFDAGELPDGRLYIVMEFLTGRTLYEIVQDEGRLEVPRAVRIVRDVARAVRAAHQVGIIHRDLKPDNVMLVDRGEGESVKVLDFGISASAERSGEEARLTVPGHALGTPAYMAPEQARGHRPTERFDLYALGVMFFEVLTGEPPFDSENLVEVMTRKTTERAPSLDLARPGLPADLVKLVDSCLEIQPERRPASAEAFLERLDEVLGGLPRRHTTRPPSEVRSGATAATVSAEALVIEPAKSRVNPLAIGAVAAAAGLAGFGLYIGTQGDDSAPAVAQGDAAEAPAGAVTPAESAEPGSEAGPTAQVAQADPPAGTLPDSNMPEARDRAGAGSQEAAPPAEPPTAARDRATAEPEQNPPPPSPAAATPDEPASAPSVPVRPALATTPRCARVRREATDARKAGDAKALLRHVEEPDCWANETEFAALAVWAFAETRDWASCMEVGRGVSDPDVRKITSLCRKRAARESGGE